MDDADGGRVLISGATGLVGRRLMDALAADGRALRGLSRSGRSLGAGIESVGWDGIDPGTAALEGVAHVVHLSGEPIFGGLPSRSRLARVRRSRIESTRAIVSRIAELSEDARPETLVCASAVGYYGDCGERVLDENGAKGSGFLADVCGDWEAEAERATELGVRVVRVRIGVVLSSDGGALSLMAIPFKLGLGGKLGSGEQFFPWIHVDDLVGVLRWAIQEGEARGAVNAVAPEAVRNSDLTTELGEVLGRPTFLSVPAFAIRLALGEVSGELLGSRRVVPARLEEAGFSFRYPTLSAALEAELD